MASTLLAIEMKTVISRVDYFEISDEVFITIKKSDDACTVNIENYIPGHMFNYNVFILSCEDFMKINDSVKVYEEIINEQAQNN